MEKGAGMKSEGFNWSRYIWIMGVLFPAVIVFFDMLTFSRIIPTPIIREYLVLTYKTPNVFSMFFSNFVHANLAHMIENMMSYLITMAFIVVVAIVAVPYLNKKNPDLKYRFNTNTLVISTVLFVLVVPFVISMESIVLGNYIGVAGGLGFSGIGFAFEGYLVYVMETLILCRIRLYFRKRDEIMAYNGMFVAATIPIVILGMQIIMMYTSTVMANYAAHMVGFALGMMIPLCVDRIDSYMRKKQRVVVENEVN